MSDFLPTDMTLPSWYTTRIAPNGDVDDNEGGCHPSEAAALRAYLSPHIIPFPSNVNQQPTSPSNSTQQPVGPSNPPLEPPTPSEAALAITSFIASQPDPKDHLHHLWGLLEDALADAPYSALDALIELMAAIEDLPNPPAFSPPPATNPSPANDGAAPDATRFWKGSVQFANLWYDMYPSYSWRSFVAGTAGPRREELRATHIRRAEVEARLVSKGLADVPLDWGYEVVADALERSTTMLDFEVPAAVRWVVWCAGLFKEDAEVGKGSWALRSSGGEGGRRDLWVGEDGEGDEDGDKMTLRRWAFWGERLRALQEDPELVRDVRAALEAMGEV